MYHIKNPKTQEEWDQYYDLRYRILRKAWNQPKGSEKDKGEETATHFTLYDSDKKILGVARLDLFFPNAQLRFFAIEEGYQGKGIGKFFLHYILLIYSYTSIFLKKINEIILPLLFLLKWAY